VSNIILRDSKYFITKEDIRNIKTNFFARSFKEGYLDKMDDLPFSEKYDLMNKYDQFRYEAGRKFSFYFQGDIESDEAAIEFYKILYDNDMLDNHKIF